MIYWEKIFDSFRFERQVFSTTSAHGFHWIIDDPALGKKIFWFILSFSFLALGLVLSFISIKESIKRLNNTNLIFVISKWVLLQAEITNPKYSTALEIQEGDIVNGEPFPDFAICDPNPFSARKVRK